MLSAGANPLEPALSNGFMFNEPKNKIEDITEEEIWLLAEDMKNDPRMIENARLFSKKANLDIPDWDIDTIQMLAKGLMVKIWMVNRKKSYE